MYTDSHCHLDRLDLEPWDNKLELVVADAIEQGVSRQLCIGISLANAQKVIAIADRFPSVFATVGVHPMEPHEQIPTLDSLKSLAQHPRVVGIGETGLDYYYSSERIEAQQESFRRHLEVASQLDLPAVVHTRDAKEDTIGIIRETGSEKGVLHCFTEDWDMAKRALDLGYYISISGIVTFHNASALREVAQKIPHDRLLIETDSPWLSPVPYRGKPNYPAYVRVVGEFLADLRGVTAGQLAEETTRNFLNLFSQVEVVEAAVSSQ